MIISFKWYILEWGCCPFNYLRLLYIVNNGKALKTIYICNKGVVRYIFVICIKEYIIGPPILSWHWTHMKLSRWYQIILPIYFFCRTLPDESRYCQDICSSSGYWVSTCSPWVCWRGRVSYPFPAIGGSHSVCRIVPVCQRNSIQPWDCHGYIHDMVAGRSPPCYCSSF